MRVVALEEHFTVPALVKRIDPASSAAAATSREAPTDRPNPLENRTRSAKAFRSMDDAGITSAVELNPAPICRPTASPSPAGYNDHLRRRSRVILIACWLCRAADAESRRLATELGARSGSCASPARSSTAPPRAAFSITRTTATCWRPPRSSTCRSTSTRTFRPSRCGRPITPISRRARRACSKAPPGAGIRRRRSMCFAWCWPARSTSIRSSTSSSVHGRNAARDAGPHRRGWRLISNI